METDYGLLDIRPEIMYGLKTVQTTIRNPGGARWYDDSYSELEIVLDSTPDQPFNLTAEESREFLGNKTTPRQLWGLPVVGLYKDTNLVGLLKR